MFRSLQIFLGEHRGQREDIADIVEAVPIRVDGKLIRRAQIQAEKVADGVVVFVPIQAMGSDAARIGRCVPVDLRVGTFHPRRNQSQSDLQPVVEFPSAASLLREVSGPAVPIGRGPSMRRRESRSGIAPGLLHRKFACRCGSRHNCAAGMALLWRQMRHLTALRGRPGAEETARSALMPYALTTAGGTNFTSVPSRSLFVCIL